MTFHAKKINRQDTRAPQIVVKNVLFHVSTVSRILSAGARGRAPLFN